MDELRREPAREQEAGLRGALGRVSRQRGEAPAADREGALELRLGERPRELDRQLQRVLGQLVLDAQVAEAGLACMDARLDEAFVRQEAIRLEPVEQRVDLQRRRRPAAVFVVGAALTTRAR